MHSGVDSEVLSSASLMRFKDLSPGLSFFRNLLTSSQLELLKAYLGQRVRAASEKSGLGVIFDVTYWCNLRCPWCCSTARLYPVGGRLQANEPELPTAQLFKILEKIRDYLDRVPVDEFFLNFGGGEPFIRPDFATIVRVSSELFGPGCVGFDNNGTLATAAELEELLPLVSYVGISLDGLADHHNRERGLVNGHENTFQKVMATIRHLLSLSGGPQTLEVSTVITRKNLDQIPDLMKLLRSVGVQKYSVHRTMQVGRGFMHFQRHPELLPEAADYVRLLARILEVNRELGLDVHIHHSLESIYSTLLLGVDTYVPDKLGYADKRSSIAIDPHGKVFFDPWCMNPPLDGLASVGSLMDDGVSLDSVFEMGILRRARESCKRSIRCHGCPQHCSGGSRIAALTNYLTRAGYLHKRAITEDRIVEGLRAIDPACPLYDPIAAEDGHRRDVPAREVSREAAHLAEFAP